MPPQEERNAPDLGTITTNTQGMLFTTSCSFHRKCVIAWRERNGEAMAIEAKTRLPRAATALSSITSIDPAAADLDSLATNTYGTHANIQDI